MTTPAPPDDLLGDIIAEVARCHGVAISRDDPILAVVLLNQALLRRYLEAVVMPTASAIRTATAGAIAQVEEVAAAQALWLEQVSLKDRAPFLEEQKKLHQAWKADMQALIDSQNAALQQLVLQTIALLKAQADVTPVQTPPPSPQEICAPWISLAMAGLGAALGAALVAALGAAAMAWGQ
jgi:hypothetical protein